MASIPLLLRQAYRLLRQTSPADDYDVAWHGPYFIPRRGEWEPTHFLLYGGHLHATVTMGWQVAQLTWRVGTREVRCAGESGLSRHSEDLLWRRVLEQIVPRLRAAVKDPERYNRRVERLLPLACRTGRIARLLTWPRGKVPPISESRLRRLEASLAAAEKRPGLRAMTLSRYLETASIGLDAAYKDLEDLSALAKYRKR